MDDDCAAAAVVAASVGTFLFLKKWDKRGDDDEWNRTSRRTGPRTAVPWRNTDSGGVVVVEFNVPMSDRSRLVRREQRKTRLGRTVFRGLWKPRRGVVPRRGAGCCSLVALRGNGADQPTSRLCCSSSVHLSHTLRHPTRRRHHCLAAARHACRTRTRVRQVTVSLAPPSRSSTHCTPIHPW